MRSLGALLSLGLCLIAPPTLAEPDMFELGNGQHGALRVQQMDTVINTATALTAPASEGSKSLSVADATGFAAGELVLLFQVSAEELPSPPDPNDAVKLGDASAGRWELARLQAVTESQLTLTAPLVSSFAAPGTQVVRVPEYTSVHVLPAGSLVAPPWDGTSGGVLAFLANEGVILQGSISADGAGFRGGTFAFNRGQLMGCTELNQPQELGGAQKGEGLFSAAPDAPTHGYGNLGNGAGGGNCDEGGGGGGGHGGVGGNGGFTRVEDGSRDVGGRGGQALHYSPLTRLMFGGGGGAGSGDSNGNNTGSSGAAGGGIIFFRASDLQGQGEIHANGLSAGDSLNDASGGGGAGGLITVRVKNGLDCTGISANGGNGGSNTDTANPHAPGGGGAGGMVLVQAATLGCPISVLPGLAGSSAAASGPYGATPTVDSQPENQGTTTEVDEGFGSPAVPVWVTPTEGEATGPRPQLQGTAQPGSSVRVYLNDQLLSSVEASETGSFTVQPASDLDLGSYQVRASAERLGVRSGLSDPRAFTVGPLSPVDLEVGCGCGSTQAHAGAWLALAGVLLGLSRRRAGAVGSGHRGTPGGAGRAGG